MRSLPGILWIAASVMAASAAPRSLAAQDDPRPDASLICLVVDGELAELPMEVDPRTGDTLVAGRPLDEMTSGIPSPYLSEAEWRFEEPTVTFQGRRLVTYGTPRVMPPADLRRVGEYRGIPIFGERNDASARRLWIYLPLQPGCVFQPFVDTANVGEVRGE